MGSCLRVIIPPGQNNRRLEELSKKAAHEDRRHAVSDMIEAALSREANGKTRNFDTVLRFAF
jgi:hypothetical protein